MATLDVQTHPLAEDVHVMALSGEVDLHTCPKVREAVNRLVNESHVHLIVDLEETRYIDSTGLVVLLHALKRIQEKGGRLAVVCRDAHILKVFTIAGLMDSFNVRPSQAEAIALVRS